VALAKKKRGDLEQNQGIVVYYRTTAALSKLKVGVKVKKHTSFGPLLVWGGGHRHPFNSFAGVVPKGYTEYFSAMKQITINLSL